MLNNNIPQLDLFGSVLEAYTASVEPISNNNLYSLLQKQGFNVAEAEHKEISGNVHNLAKRQVRWIQQTLKDAGVIKRVERGVWEFLDKAPKSDLHGVKPGFCLLGFSTRHGAAILGTCESFFSKFKAPIHLILTSPPYPLKTARKYGNVEEREYVDWLCRVIEPVIDNLAPGGSVAINLGNEIFLDKSPARSMYVERLVLALNERFGLWKMDNLIWENPTRPPGPCQWASKNRVQLNATYENVIWMCNDPEKCFADNRRVLLPHSEQHMKFMLAGGSKTYRSNADGSHRVYPGAYGNITQGKIPRNVLHMAHRCADQLAYKKNCKSLNIVPHGAPMPLRLAEFLIAYLTEVGQTVVDPFAGSFTVPKAAEILNRLWFATEMMYEYVLASGSRFDKLDGYKNFLEAA